MYFLSANNKTSIFESSLYPRLSFTAETFVKDICFELKTIKCQIVQRDLFFTQAISHMITKCQKGSLTSAKALTRKAGVVPA